MPPTLYIGLALLVVVVTRRFAPRAASVLGIAVALGIGVWGGVTYGRGGGMTVLGGVLSPIAFFGFVAILILFEALNLYTTVRRRHRTGEAPSP